MRLPARSPDPGGRGRGTPRPPGRCSTVPGLPCRVPPALLPVSGAGSVAGNPAPWALARRRSRSGGLSCSTLTRWPPSCCYEGPGPWPACLMEEPASVSGGWFAQVSTDWLQLCFQMNMQPRFQLNYQKHLSFLPDSTTGMEEEVS